MTSYNLYSNNEEAWYSMLRDCAKATKSIDLEQFIFATDDLGKRLIDICAERARNGVRVRFLWDAAGSFTFWGSSIVDELKEKGIELVFWKTLVPSYFKLPNFRYWFLRNHRRTIVIDGVVGYTGSICMNDRMKNWRDTNARFEGDIVLEMKNAFDRMWERAKNIKPLSKRILAKDPEFKYITNYPSPGRRHIYNRLLHAIRRSYSHIYITAPYFVPTHRLAVALKKAAKRKIDVCIIIPEKSDYFAVDLGARSFFSMLLEAGVKIYLYHGNMIHSKTVTIDDNWASIGSMNMDRISLLYNFEANMISTNENFSKEVAEHFLKDLKESKQVILEEWQDRSFLEKMPEVLIKLVRKFL